MPLVHINLRKGKSREYIKAVADGVHQALAESYNVPADDRFQLIRQYDADEFIYDADYLGVHRTDDLVIIQITAGSWRDTETKQRLYQTIVANLTRATGIRAEDVFVSLVGVGKDDWSFGNGQAQYIK
ncbi:tautomerase family protein [Pseudoduganella sp. RAF53_2]|uniref:tautomerase family protein n=1 Tax=unclassified Pseudoduganella TaxID=2637179 RepID=UPI003F9AEE96